MMTSAYHWVYGGKKGIHDILKAKALSPASSRLSRADIDNLCFTPPLLSWAASESGGEKKYKAIELLVETYQKNLRKSKATHKTGFTCIDIIAGDADRIFFSVEEFSRDIAMKAYDGAEGLPDEEQNRLIVNGFEFDVEELIFDLGARARDMDLLNRYWAALSSVEVREEDSIEKVADMILSAMATVQDENEIDGKEAYDYVVRGKYLAEMIVDGPVPISFAKYVYIENKRYFQDELSEIFPDLARILP